MICPCRCIWVGKTRWHKVFLWRSYPTFSSEKHAIKPHALMRIHHDVDLHTHTQSLALTDSVTRFGEILPLNHNNKNLWPFSKDSNRIWQSFELTLANIICYWANSHCWKWQNIKIIPSHLVTLLTGTPKR